MFSVLLSVYYRESPIYFTQSLNSVFSQTRPPSEVVLVQDGPLTKELDSVITSFISQYPSILKVVKLSTNQGLGKALNEGLKYCSYDFVARMDTDDIAKPCRFERQLDVFERNCNIDVVGSWLEEFEGNINNVLSTRKLPELHKDIYEFAKSRNPINHPVVMFRKDAVWAVGGYQHFPFFEDYFLWVRLLMNRAQFYNIQDSLLYFRLSSDMFKRRGGWKYAMDEIYFQNAIRKMGFISLWQFIKNVFIRFVARIIPNSVRATLYKKLLRK